MVLMVNTYKNVQISVASNDNIYKFIITAKKKPLSWKLALTCPHSTQLYHGGICRFS